AKENVVICPRRVNLGMTVWDQYCESHNTEDFCWIISIISSKYPFLRPYISEQLNSVSMYSYNMFITNWELFDQICSLWFDILQEFELHKPRVSISSYQARDISFLAERIFDIWLRYRVASGTRVIEVPIFFIKQELDNLRAERDALIAE